MRKLTVKRKKKIAACAVKMQVWISAGEDAHSVIKGVPCRKLGELKNGAEETWEISEDAARLFVIANEKTADHYSEICDIPAGSGDVFLSGHNVFLPSTGDPFFFDNVEPSAESAANRRANAEAIRQKVRSSAGKRRLTLILLIVFISLAAIAAGYFYTTGAKTFTVRQFSVTLTREFSEIDLSGGDDFSVACYADKHVTVYVDEYPAALLPEEYRDFSAEDFAELFKEDSGEVRVSDGLVYICYELEYSGQTFVYYDFYYKQGDYRILTFISEKEYAEKHYGDFFKWAGSVKIADEAEV